MATRRPNLAYDDAGNLLIDVRGPRFGAAITMTVLAVALVVQGPVGVALVAWQWVAFAISTFAGLAWSPYGNLFRVAKRRLDLGPPPATEHEGPPRFAQACGLAVTTVALVLFAVGGRAASPRGSPSGIVLALSTLLALTGICVGCELYLLGPAAADPGVGGLMLLRLVIVLAVIGAAALVGAWWRARDGRVREVGDGRFSPDQLARVGLDRIPRAGGALLLGSPTCAPCVTVKSILGEVADERRDFTWTYVDAAEHMDIADAHHVMRVPTLFVLDGRGRILARTSGVPAKRDLLAVLDREASSLDPAA